MVKINKVLKNRWGWTTAIALTLLGTTTGFAFLASLGTGTADYLSSLIPLAISGMIVTFIHGFVLGLGLEQVFKK